MVRLAYALAVGLLGAGIIHIAILLLLPEFSERDAWSRLEENSAAVYQVARIDQLPATALTRRPADPLFYVNACRFSLEDGFAHIKAAGKVPFWSVSVYDRSGRNIFSFNDRATPTDLDFVVVTPAQMIEIRKELPEELVTSIFVEADVDEGIALVRAFVPDASWAPAVADYMKAMSCRQE